MTQLTNFTWLRKALLLLSLLPLSHALKAQNWIPIPQEAKPYTRWGWMGSAVDSIGLDHHLTAFAKVGIGGVEITPIYGVRGNDSNDIPFLSSQWMRMLQYVETRGGELGIETCMATGTGWPFGGPWVSKEDAACRVVFDEQQNATLGRTGQKVKRAAPGGEGFVIDHFDRDAVSRYLAHFDDAFARQNVPFPHTLFNDSYEVYGADWTPKLYEEFQKRRGYDLQPVTYILNKKDSLRTDADKRIISDYRETLGELLLENFTTQCTDWAHKHGSITRNQAHGSPANLLDVYAAVDIPECEGFGLSDFGIKGLRADKGFTKKNDSDISMLQYASSAAHVSGKKFTSSETFTWLTEHFRTSLSQCKPDLDLMFVSGVNHVFFHGTCYSPQNDPWPGWKFYASIDMSPTNSIWHDAPYFMQYITRCQSFLQWGQPDNDFLVYLPFRKMLSQRDGKNIIMQFDIHSMDKKAPEFIRSIQEIDSLGYDCDYISDQYLQTTTVVDGMLRTAAGTRYKALLIPDSTYMPQSVRQRIQALQQAGANISYGYSEALMRQAAVAEQMKTRYHLKAIRRKNDKGYHYFISNLSDHDVSGNIALSVKYKDAMFFDPLTGARHAVYIHNDSIALSLHSGESVILETFDRPTATGIMQKPCRYLHPKTISGKWKLAFTDSHPQVKETFVMDTLHTWETLADDSVQETMGTGSYTTTFMMSSKEIKSCRQWAIDLGDVRESARVWINGRYIGCAWCLPYILDCQDALHAGRNTLRIDVTNLPANRIAAMDRKGIKWRKFNEINIVDLNYKKTTYEHWAPVKSGLNSNVTLYQLHP